jgi:hypothetical protein
MRSKPKLVFDGTAVLELLTHAKAAQEHSSPYGLTPNPGPGLMLVKDDGIYFMSNGKPELPGIETVNKVVYARAYEAIPLTASIDERSARYDKIREAVGGDDFAEFLPAKSFERLTPNGRVEILLTMDRMSLYIVAPPNDGGTKPGRCTTSA